MKDLEINKAVAEKLGIKSPAKWASTSLVSVAYSIPDYCNNPADAWPIILEYKISLNYKVDIEQWMTYYKANGWNNPVSDKNPLKAAMLCFLEMEIKGQ